MPIRPSAHNLDALQELIGCRFQNTDLLLEALTHRSYLDERPTDEPPRPCNERLEFMGNYVLDYAVAVELFRRFPHFTSGRLTQMKGILASNKNLYRIGESLNLRRCLFVSDDWDRSERVSETPIANALEALIGAVHEDLGLHEAQSLVIGLLDAQMNEVGTREHLLDPKSTLQILVQREFRVETPSYETSLMSNNVVMAEVSIAGIRAGTGTGNSRADACQKAAEDALRRIKRGELTPERLRTRHITRRQSS